MKKVIKLTLGAGLLLSLASLYAHMVHPHLFFSRQSVAYADSYALKGGQEVFFTSGTYRLRGRLAAPNEVRDRKYPAIIFTDGSGGQSSYATTFYSKFLDSLYEQNLPRDSMVFFYFEKRGVGKSEGQWFGTNFEQRAEDVKAAADYLRTLPFIDPDRIAVAGHSQGGWIVQICLSRYPGVFAGGISMAGPTFGVKQQVVNEYTTSIRCQQGLSETEARHKAARRVDVELLLATLFPLRQEWKQLSVIKDFRPAPFLTTIRKPLLLMFCENDALVSPRDCKKELQQLFPGGVPHPIQTVTIPGTNHGFKRSAICYNGPYKAIPFSEEGKQEIRQWVRSHLLSQGARE